MRKIVRATLSQLVRFHRADLSPPQDPRRSSTADGWAENIRRSDLSQVKGQVKQAMRSFVAALPWLESLPCLQSRTIAVRGRPASCRKADRSELWRLDVNGAGWFTFRPGQMAWPGAWRGTRKSNLSTCPGTDRHLSRPVQGGQVKQLLFPFGLKDPFVWFLPTQTASARLHFVFFPFIHRSSISTSYLPGFSTQSKASSLIIPDSLSPRAALRARLGAEKSAVDFPDCS